MHSVGPQAFRVFIFYLKKKKQSSSDTWLKQKSWTIKSKYIHVADKFRERAANKKTDPEVMNVNLLEQSIDENTALNCKVREKQFPLIQTVLQFLITRAIIIIITS